MKKWENGSSPNLNVSQSLSLLRALSKQRINSKTSFINKLIPLIIAPQQQPPTSSAHLIQLYYQLTCLDYFNTAEGGSDSPLAIIDSRTLVNAITTSAADSTLDLPKSLMLIQSLFMTEEEGNNQNLIVDLVDRMAPRISGMAVNDFSKDFSAVALHRRLLLVRCCLRYLCRDTIYAELSDLGRHSLRRAHRIDLKQAFPPNKTIFTEKMSALMTRLRISHFRYATRGPLEFDILERDRRMVWCCNNPSRFYINTAELSTTWRLQERLVRAMGYGVVQCQYWQWSKLKPKRSRIEYIRMSRYYALRDRREYDKEFEGWSLPHIHSLSPKVRSVHFDGYQANQSAPDQCMY
eukprot:GHVS01043251.1.p1 GENE.GHVS01043251.1~~GHVS01043251.1.p1  ORF type:complete len:350 (-),score=17.63 GHVS01043251.1:48-1097(-)